MANVAFAPSSSLLVFDNFDGGWGWSSVASPVALSATLTGLYISAVLEDDSRTADPVILAINSLSGAQDGTTYFVRMLRNYFSSAAPGGAGLLDTAKHKDGLLDNTFGYSNGKIFAWDSVSQSYVSMDPATLAVTGSFYAPGDKSSMGRLRFGYRAGGGSFYTYDPDTGIVTEYSSWW